MFKSINFNFPNNTEFEKKFFKTLLLTLSEIPNTSISGKDISLVPLNPGQSEPVTRFSAGETLFPELHFDTETDLNLELGNFFINGHITHVPQYISTVVKNVKQDSLGSYTEVIINKYKLYRLPLEELHKRLKGHITRIDHTGINIPSNLVTHETWNQFIKMLAKQTNLYKYPTGDEWPFILPATEEEFKNDISVFPVGREPKFELVYDTYSPVPTIQIDIETDLTRAEVTKLFPKPYGVGFPGLAQYFRSVYIHHEWPGLDIRFDMRYKSTNPESDWDTGKWLVQDGGRI